MTDFVGQIESERLAGHGIISWSCPVPFFGDLSSARIATVGINPSNREFVAEDGSELTGWQRRFPTLSFFDRNSWSEIDHDHVDAITEACIDYFYRAPYDRWFKTMERIVQAARASLYVKGGGACHVDLVPYATHQKWGTLGQLERRKLLKISARPLGRLLRESSIETLILNGRAVVSEFEQLSGIELERNQQSAWSLPRSTGRGVQGFSYTGSVSQIGGVALRAPIKVLGYNHNLQSSFGVTRSAVDSIARWIELASMKSPK